MHSGKRIQREGFRNPGMQAFCFWEIGDEKRKQIKEREKINRGKVWPEKKRAVK